MIMNQKKFEKAIDRDRKAGKLTRERAIHYHCIDCMGYSVQDVAGCQNKECPLWEYRTGTYTPLGENAGEEDG